MVLGLRWHKMASRYASSEQIKFVKLAIGSSLEQSSLCLLPRGNGSRSRRTALVLGLRWHKMASKYAGSGRSYVGLTLGSSLEWLDSCLPHVGLSTPRALVIVPGGTGGTVWQPDTRVPNVDMLSSPSAVVYNTNLYVFHKVQNQQLWYSHFDGTNWQPDTQVPNMPAGIDDASGFATGCVIF